MSHQPLRLSRNEILALKFAAHRQLARWANKPKLSAHQHAQRTALARAVRTLQADAFAQGCALRGVDSEEARDE
ncbi:MAG: hypothetical protein ACRDLN_03295 [Solirubrobacteraceae bacterium]